MQTSRIAGAHGEIDLLTIDEAASYLSTSKSTLYRLLGQGQVTGTKVGKQWRFRKSDLQTYLRQGAERIEAESGEVDEERLMTLLDEGPVVAMGGDIVKKAIAADATGIHIEPRKQDVRVRFRIDSALNEAMCLPKDDQNALISRFKMLSDMKVLDRRLPQQGRIPVRHEGRDFDLHVTCMPTNFGESIVIGVFNKSNVLPLVDKLGFDANELMGVTEILQKRSGALVVSGPARSGKTTHVYSFLNHLNKPEAKILTIEDPVEYILPGTMQTHVIKKIGLTYPAALRAFARQDSDVIMVGETRDLETAQLVLDASLAGSLVLTAMNATSVVDTLVMLVELGVEPRIIAGAVSGIINLRMVKRLCTNCRAALGNEAVTETLADIGNMAAEGGYIVPDTTVFYTPVGCPECRGSGFKGQVALHEVFRGSPSSIKEILRCSSPDEMQRLAVKNGMRTLFADGMSKAANGETTVEEVVRTTVGAL